MLKAITMVAQYAWVRVQVACTKNRAAKWRMLSKFEKKCDKILAGK